MKRFSFLEIPHGFFCCISLRQAEILSPPSSDAYRVQQSFPVSALFSSSLANIAAYAIKIAIAKYFNISVDYLLGLTDIPRPFMVTISFFALPPILPKQTFRKG